MILQNIRQFHSLSELENMLSKQEDDDKHIIEEQKLSNRKTNEELSISPPIEYKGYRGTEIKRSVERKQNSLPKP